MLTDTSPYWPIENNIKLRANLVPPSLLGIAALRVPGRLPKILNCGGISRSLTMTWIEFPSPFRDQKLVALAREYAVGGNARSKCSQGGRQGWTRWAGFEQA